MTTQPCSRPRFTLFAKVIAATLLACLPAVASADDPPEPGYVYWAKFVRIVDGSHVALDIDLGFGVWVHNQSLELLDAGGAEQDTEARAKDNQRIAKLRELFADTTDIVVKTERVRNANPPRYLATIWADGTNVNEALKTAFP